MFGGSWSREDMKTFFILIPQMVATGPVKGAIALANALVHHRSVAIVSLRHGSGANAFVDNRVTHICLEDSCGNLFSAVGFYRSLLRQHGGRKGAISISMCFSADFVNRFCRADAVVISSVRGNLKINYSMDYGWPGRVLSYFHFYWISSFDKVVAMTRSMADQLDPYLKSKSAVIGNFVDERMLERHRRKVDKGNAFRFSYLASVTPRKQPLLVLGALVSLRNSGHDVFLDMMGDGSLRRECEEFVEENDLKNNVKFHGEVANPYDVLSGSDALVIPSLSEGLSRASLEALYLGVPCVLRNVDGNADLITTGVNGVLFVDPHDLPSAMLQAANISRELSPGSVLLSTSYRQASCADQYLKLAECIE